MTALLLLQFHVRSASDPACAQTATNPGCTQPIWDACGLDGNLKGAGGVATTTTPGGNHSTKCHMF